MPARCGASMQGTGLPQRPGLAVDGQRRFVAEDVPDHGGQHKASCRVAIGDADDVDVGIDGDLSLRLRRR